MNTSTSQWEVQLFEPNFDGEEEREVAEVVQGRWLTMGERTQAFEGQFAELLGENTCCVAVASATAALHMSLLSLGIGQGDEVIIPALTFVADANVVRMVGATPVLADSESLDDWNISPRTIEPCITSRTRAVILVHFAGFPCDVSQISQLCKKHNLKLIEDAAHAPGSSVDGQMCGTFGDTACFSFFSNKNISIGEGGMVVTRNKAVSESLRLIRSHGMTSLTLDRHQGRTLSYDVVKLGLNYRIDEMRAAIGSIQLEKLSNGNQKRKILFEEYRSRLEGLGILIPFGGQGANRISAYHIMPVLLPTNTDRLEIVRKLKEKRIQTSIHYPAFWEFSFYKEFFHAEDTPVSKEICKRELTLPLFPTMTFQKLEYVVSSLIEALD